MSQQGHLFTPSHVVFADRFLQDHAGQIISDARTAILELVSNAYDAGATKVLITWPSKLGGLFAIEDNGTGLTRQQFEERWMTLNYDRTSRQGPKAQFPNDVKPLPRRNALGQSGKGRLAPFCFADSYSVQTRIDGKSLHAEVQIAHNSIVPFRISGIAESESDGHGTTISTKVDRRRIDSAEIVQLIGSKFLVDPSFNIWVNDERVQLIDLDDVESAALDIGEGDTITIHFVDSPEHTKSARLRGITWWVNQRMVGDPSWERLDHEGAYLDGRTEHAKRFSFIVESDALKKSVKHDWSGFHANKKVLDAQNVAHEAILTKLREREAGTRRERKRAALTRSRELLGELPTISRKIVGQFIDEVQERCPTMADRDLERTVNILATLEESRWGYDLLGKLESCSADDLDTWNEIMSRWTAENASIVLSELERRLTLINRMQNLVRDPKADELHELQPLFERGLWIFGPEFEAVDFRSNRGLTEVIRQFLGGQPATIPESRRRPDVVVVPNHSIGGYSADAYDSDGEVSGLRKVVIVELKKGGFNVTQAEVDQARDYCKELRKTGAVQKHTSIVAYVLGASIDEGLEHQSIGDPPTTQLIPMVYDTVLLRAQARTFNLQSRLKGAPLIDPDVEAVVKSDQATFL